MTQPPPQRDQGERLTKTAIHRRRRRRRVPRRRTVGPARPGRFFRTDHRLLNAWLALEPYDLGEVHWLLYRRQHNPYRLGTWKAINYARGFAACKIDTPKPAWEPIP